MLSYTFYTLTVGGTLFLICGALFLLPPPILARLNEYANKVLVATDQKIAPYRVWMGMVFLLLGLWAFYQLFLLVKSHPALFG